MGSENLAYALIQVVHNFGAAAVLGGAVFALWPISRMEYGRTFAWLILLAWGAQIASGGLFGITSLYYYGETPDLSRIAMAALAIKVVSAISGFLLAAWSIRSLLGLGVHADGLRFAQPSLGWPPGDPQRVP